MKDPSGKRSYHDQRPQAALPHLFFLTRDLLEMGHLGAASAGGSGRWDPWGSPFCPQPGGTHLAQAGIAFAGFKHESCSSEVNACATFPS